MATSEDWQGMDTAPQDGTRILLHFPGENPDVRIGAWTHRRMVDGASGDVVSEQIGWAMGDRAEIRPSEDAAAWAPCESPPADRFVKE